MWRRSSFVTAALIVFFSAAIAYAIVFLVPRYTGYDVYDYVYTYQSLGGYYFDDKSLRNIEDLTKLQPQEFQEVVQRLFDDLIKLPEAQLYMLNAVDDVCKSTLLECQGVPSKVVKPFVEKALSYKQTRDAAAISAGSLDTARLSLAVAFAAFLVSLAGLFVKRKA